MRTEPADRELAGPATTDAAERVETESADTVFSVLATQARSRTAAELWTTAIGGAVNAILLLWQHPNLSWLIGGFTAVAAYGAWGLADRAVERSRLAGLELANRADHWTALRGLAAGLGIAGAVWAVIGVMLAALGTSWIS